MTEDVELELLTPGLERELQASEEAVWASELESVKMILANAAALELWRAESFEDLEARFTGDPAIVRRTYDSHWAQITSPEGMVLRWTIYPLGEPVQVSLNLKAMKAPSGVPCIVFRGNRVDAGDDDSARLYMSTRYLDTLIATFDAEGEFLVQNAAAARAHPHIDGRATTLRDRFVDAADHARLLKDLEDSDVATGEVRIRTVSGDLWFATTLHSARDPGTGDPMLVLHQTNIERVRRAEEALTEKNTALASALEQLKELQTRLVTSERLAAVGGLVAGIAHEINTPLGAIVSSATTTSRLVDRHVEKHGETRGMTMASESQAMITSAAGRIGGIVDNLRSFVRLDQADKQLVSLNDELDKTLSVANHRLLRKVRIDKDYGELPDVSCDSRRLNQALLAVILNAAQAVDATGSPGRVTIRTRVEGDHVLIEIEDSGVGMSAEIIDQIFEPGFSTREGASGLGLAMAEVITADHGGRLEARSEGPGEGATLTLALPVEPPRP